MGYAFGRKWSDELIKEEILKVMKTLNIDRMPSSKEIKLVTNNSKLVNAIKRHGGYLQWSARLRLHQSDCETRTGFNAEIKIKEILEKKGYKVENMTCKHPYDLLVNENIKIDVKAANKYESSKGHICSCCKGNRRTAGGYIWRYADAL